MYKATSIISANFHWRTEIKIIKYYASKQSRDMYLILVEILTEICRLSIRFTKKIHSKKQKITYPGDI